MAAQFTKLALASLLLTSLLIGVAPGAAAYSVRAQVEAANSPYSSPVPPSPLFTSGSPSTKEVNIPVGAAPEGEAYCPIDQNTYVAVRGEDEVAIINRNNKVIENITGIGGDDPYSPITLAFDPANNLMYASAGGGSENEIYSISCKSHMIVKTITDSRFDGPWGLAYDPANEMMYVMQRDSKTVCEVDSKDVVSKCLSLSNGRGAYSASYDPVNQDLYVSAINNGTVIVLNASDAIVATVVIGFDQTPAFLGFDPLNNYTYVPLPFNGAVVAITPDFKVLQVHGSFSSPEQVSFDPKLGAMLVANLGTDTVSIVPSLHALNRDFVVGYDPCMTLYSPANGDVYATDLGSASVTAIRTG